MKRFYKTVSVSLQQGGFSILLDGKPVKTPSRQTLLAPTEVVANMVLREWAAQETEIRPQSMPVTQILSTKIDKVAQERPSMTALLLKYIDTDLLCYRTEMPAELAAQQAAAWDPWLKWFEHKSGIAMQTTTALAALAQPPAAHKALSRFVEGLDDNRFTILQIVAPLSGSLILALAFTEGSIGAEALFDAVNVDERYKATLYNEEKYGPDPAQQKKDEAFKEDLVAAEGFLKAL